jgi:uncharacterized protein YutE (UPF0331/DUF86 family)
MERERLRRYVDKIGHIEERIGDIRSWLAEFEDIGALDRKTRLAVYKAMQEAVEAATDIGAMILKDEGNLPQDDYTNIARLCTLGIIDDQLKAALNEADGLRNRLVHGYNELNDALAMDSIQELLSPLERFVSKVTAWVKRSA